ncbi:MAG TPA: FeoA family protein [Bryobacteraceae bacterium]|nr:FeoA family protein [Bryobacteraceae bacterium]
MLQLSVNKRRSDAHRGPALTDLRRGEAGVLDRLDLPEEDARRLMELGFLPGSRITAALSAPGGDPRVFEVDGSEVALRRETAARLKLRFEPGSPGMVPNP